MAVSCGDNDIASYSRVGNLAGDIFVAEPDDKTILGGVVLVFVLRC